MPSNSRQKKSSPVSPSKSAATQQMPPRQLPPHPESQLHSPLQHQQPQPDNPWSVLRPTFHSKDVPPSTSSSPFPRHSPTLSITATGELLFFGGFAHRSLHNDLYVFSTQDCSVNFLKTGGEVPSPRFLSAGVLVSNVLLIWGGATKLDDKFRAIGPYDNSLYLLSLVSREWTRIPVNGPGPVGRFGHTMTMVGSKLFVFGGKTDEKCLNDMWALNLNTLVNSKLGWDSYEPPSGDEKPPPRSQHVAVSTSDRIILFGGTHDRKCYNDTWVFDISTRKWTELQCTGPIPSPRCSHAAALVDDVMYVFGGRDAERRHLGDLIAFKLSTRQWFMLRNMGNPRGRLGHAMVSNETRVFVLGGKLATGAQADELALIHVLETKRIENPKPDPSGIKPSEKTTQPALISSVGPSTQRQPQPPTSSSSDTFVAHVTSPFQNSTPTSVNGRKRHVPEKNDNRVVELERQLSATPAAKTERDQRLVQLTEELALKSALLEQAEATKRAGLGPRELTDRLLAQTLLMEYKDAELVRMQAKLDELMLSRDQALQTSTSRIAVADERSQRTCEQIRQYEAELAKGKSELEAVRLRLTEAEIGLAKSKAEADTLRALTTTILVGTDEDRMTRVLLERIRAMEAEMADMRWSEKSLEAMETRNEG